MVKMQRLKLMQRSPIYCSPRSSAGYRVINQRVDIPRVRLSIAVGSYKDTANSHYTRIKAFTGGKGLHAYPKFEQRHPL